MARKIGFGFLLIVALPILLWLVYMRPGPSSIYYPPYDLTAIATPFDTTGSITLNWFSLEGDDSTAAGFSTYRVLRSSNAEGPFEEIGVVGFDAPRTSQLARQFRDITVGAGFQYYYKISNEINGVTIESNVIGPLESAPVIPEEEQTAMQGEVVFHLRNCGYSILRTMTVNQLLWNGRFLQATNPETRFSADMIYTGALTRTVPLKK